MRKQVVGAREMFFFPHCLHTPLAHPDNYRGEFHLSGGEGPT